MADTIVTTAVSVAQDSEGLWGPYWISPLIGAIIFNDDGTDPSVAYTDDGGATWAITEIQAGVTREVVVWFDQETPGDTGTLLHIFWLNAAGADNAYYMTYDINTDTHGTIRTVDSAITVAASSENNKAAITKTVGGNIIVAFQTEVDVECYKSSDNFATAGTNIADVFETATAEDYVLLFPGDLADTDDACAVFWDGSASEVSLKMYDDSADSWTETSISGSMTVDITHRNMDGAVRHSDGHVLLAAHNNDDDAGDDILTWDLTVDSIATPTVTAKTNVVTDQAESAQIAVVINQQNNDVYVAYLKGGTWQATVDVVFHVSTDDMTSWGGEQAYSEAAADDNRILHGGRTVGNDGGRIQFVWFNDDLADLFVNLVNDIEIAAVAVGGRIMSSLARDGGLVGLGGIAGQGGGLAG